MSGRQTQSHPPLLPPHSSLSIPLTLPPLTLPCHSPWTDKYDTAEHNRYSEPVRLFVSSHLSQLKSEAVVHSHEEYSTIEGRSHPVCSLSEVQRKRKGVVADIGIGEDELVIEYKVRGGGGKEEDGMRGGDVGGGGEWERTKAGERRIDWSTKPNVYLSVDCV